MFNMGTSLILQCMKFFSILYAGFIYVKKPGFSSKNIRDLPKDFYYFLFFYAYDKTMKRGYFSSDDSDMLNGNFNLQF